MKFEIFRIYRTSNKILKRVHVHASTIMRGMRLELKYSSGVTEIRF